MSEEQLKALLEAVKVDPGLQEKLKGAADANAVAAVAKAAGFVISPEELKRMVEEVSGELSDEELEGVTGGLTDFEKVVLHESPVAFLGYLATIVLNPIE